MEGYLNLQERPDVSIEQRTSSELVKLMRKLRWIGMEEAAKEMQIVLHRIDFAATLMADPCETD